MTLNFPKAKLVTLAPGLRPERRFAPLARGLFYIQLLSKSLNTLSYFTQLPYHPSFSVLLKMSKSHMISMHIVSFQNNSIFYNSYIKFIEQGVFRIKRITFSRYYVVNLKKCEIVFKLLASNCIEKKYIV